MPLIYSGQEEPLKHRLSFFGKDTIPFGNYEYENFYKKLFELKHQHKALWNGEYGAEPVRINESDAVYAFKREKEEDQVIVVLNLSDTPQTTQLTEEVKDKRELFTGEKTSIPAGESIKLEPWDYRIYY